MKQKGNRGSILPGLFAGIDVSQEWFHVGIIDNSGNTVQSAVKYDNNGCGMESMWNESQSVAEQMHLPIVYSMEASGIYHIGLLSFLNEKKASVWCFNPLVLRGERQGQLRKTKTDELDCELIAEFTRKNHMHHEQTKWSGDDAGLKERTRVRQRLVDRAAKTKAQLRRDLDILCPGLSQEMRDVNTPSNITLLRSFCQHTRLFDATADEIEKVISPFYTAKSKAAEKAKTLAGIFAGRKTADGLEEPLVDEVRYLIRELELINECTEHQERKIEKELEKKGSLVATVPGIGPVTAAIIECEIASTGRFETVNDVIAFAGLDPQKSDSGKYESTGLPISKRGSKALRTALFQSALPAIQCNPACTVLYDRLIARGKHKKVARIAVARKLLIQAFSVMRHGKEFTIPQLYLKAKAEKSAV